MTSHSNLRHQKIVGIDPDTERSGWAYIDLRDRTIELESLPLLELLERIRLWADSLIVPISECFVLEDIWSTAHNWHVSPGDSRFLIAKKGYHLGRCAQVGLIIRDAIIQHAFPHICQPPLAKCWRGADRKITHEEFLELCKRHRLTLDDKHLRRTNQEERDAALLAIHHLSSPLGLFTRDK